MWSSWVAELVDGELSVFRAFPEHQEKGDTSPLSLEATSAALCHQPLGQRVPWPWKQDTEGWQIISLLSFSLIFSRLSLQYLGGGKMQDFQPKLFFAEASQLAEQSSQRAEGSCPLYGCRGEVTAEIKSFWPATLNPKPSSSQGQEESMEEATNSQGCSDPKTPGLRQKRALKKIPYTLLCSELPSVKQQKSLFPVTPWLHFSIWSS